MCNSLANDTGIPISLGKKYTVEGMSPSRNKTANQRAKQRARKIIESSYKDFSVLGKIVSLIHI
jgi:hypothetical protein